jgi:hypothetical protein
MAAEKGDRVIPTQLWINEPHLMSSLRVDDALHAGDQPHQLLIDVLKERVGSAA